MNFLKNMLFFIFPRKCEMCETISESYICDKCKSKLEKTELYLNRIDDYSKDNTKYFDEHAYIFEYNSIIREKIIMIFIGKKENLHLKWAKAYLMENMEQY